MSCADLSVEDIQETELVGYLAAQEGVTGAEVPIESDRESSELFRTDTRVTQGAAKSGGSTWKDT